MAKVKTLTQPAPESIEDARNWMAQFGEQERALQAINAQLSDDTAKLKEEAGNKADPIKAELKRLGDGLAKYAEANRKMLTANGKTKTVDLGTGKISWRIRPPSVGVRGKETVIEFLKLNNLDDFLRVKYDLNKEAMLAQPDKAKGIAGISIKSVGEDLIIEPSSDTVSENAA